MDARHPARVATKVTSQRPYRDPAEATGHAEARVYAFAQQTANAVVIDTDGYIVDANESWRLFARLNDGRSDATDVGANYLAECDRAALTGAHEARDAAEGLRRVLLTQAEAIADLPPQGRLPGLVFALHS